MATFQNISVPLGGQPAIYQISIRAPQSGFADFATYTFPLTPSSLRVERSSLSSYTDVQGDPTTQGVTRVVDTYGLSPPTFIIEGTTGWDRHSADGFLLTGLQSIQALQAFLAQYASLNQIQRQTNNPNLYALEFYDYFGNNFWQIEPVGPQMIRQSADRPLLTYYRFRWVGIQPVGIPLFGLVDALASTLGTSAPQAAINAGLTVGAFLTAYGPTGPSSLIP